MSYEPDYVPTSPAYSPRSPDEPWPTGLLANAGIERWWPGVNTAQDIEHYDMLSAFIGPRTREQIQFRVQFVKNEHIRAYADMQVMCDRGPGPVAE